MYGGPGPYGATAPRILIVDDDPNLLVILADQLRMDGYQVTTARDGDEALRRLSAGVARPPDHRHADAPDGRADARPRGQGARRPPDHRPVGDRHADSKADLLDEVAEDYITKPYHYPELRARITRVLRRLGDRVPRQRLDLGPNLALELHRREAIVAGKTVSLTPTESRLLYALAANLGQTVTTETLLARGWADTEDADPSYVWVTMRRLRQKVELDPNKPRPPAHGARHRLPAGRERAPPEPRRRGERATRGVAAAGDDAAEGPDATGARRPAAATDGAASARIRGEAPRTPSRRAAELAADGAARTASRASTSPVYRGSGSRLPDPADARPDRRRGPARSPAFGIVVPARDAVARTRHDRRARAAARHRGRRSCSPSCWPPARRRPRRAAPGDRPVRRPGVRRRPGRLELPGDDEFSPARREPQPTRPRPRAPQPRAAPDRRRARGRAACASGLDALVAPGRRGRAGRVRDDRLRSCCSSTRARSRPRRPCPGDPVPVRADLARRRGAARRRRRATCRPRGAGSAPTRTCSSCSRSRSPSAIRNAQLYARVEDQNRRLRRARRGQGRLPARRLAQPPDAAREHPRLRAAAGDRRAGPAPRDHHRAGRPAVADGPPAADGEPDRVGRAAAPGRGRLAGRARAAGLGGARRRATSPFALDDESAAGSRSPTATSSTRCCGRSSTTPSTTAAGRAIDVAIAVDAEAGDLASPSPTTAPASRTEDRERLFQRFARGAAQAGRRGQRPRALRLARAVPGDERRPRPRAGRAAAGARRSRCTSPPRRPKRADEGLAARHRPDQANSGSGSALGTGTAARRSQMRCHGSTTTAPATATPMTTPSVPGQPTAYATKVPRGPSRARTTGSRRSCV